MDSECYATSALEPLYWQKRQVLFIIGWKNSQMKLKSKLQFKMKMELEKQKQAEVTATYPCENWIEIPIKIN